MKATHKSLGFEVVEDSRAESAFSSVNEDSAVGHDSTGENLKKEINKGTDQNKGQMGK